MSDDGNGDGRSKRGEKKIFPVNPVNANLVFFYANSPTEKEKMEGRGEEGGGESG